MDYSCGFGPGFGGSLRRGGHIRKSLSVSSKYIGGVDYVLRTQLAEQLKCMDNKWEMDYNYLNDLLDFYKKRAVLEQEYAEALNKLVQSSKQKLNADSTKRQNWPKYSYHSLLNTLLDSTSQTAAAHQILSDIYSRQMTQRLQDLQEDCTRAHKQTRELAQLCQTTVLSCTSKLTTSYRDYCNSYQLAEESKKVMDKSKEKFDRERKRAHDKNKDVEKSQKIRKLKDDLSQKCECNTRQNIQCLQSRNEYLIQIAAANTSVDKYFGQEIFDLLNCLNLGFHNAIVRAGLNHISCEKAVASTHRTAAQIIEKSVQTIDPNRDQLKFLDKNQSAFNKTSNFVFQTIKDDVITCVMSHPSLVDVFHSAIEHIMENIKESKKKFEEYWKMSSETTKKLHKLIDLRDYDVEEVFSKSILSASKNGSRDNLDLIGSRLNEIQSFLHFRSSTRNNRIELEKKYFEQFSAFIVENHHFHVLNTKLECLKQALGEGKSITNVNPTKSLRESRSIVLMENGNSGKIFGGSIQEYVKLSQQPIPPLISNTINIINLYGMHNQGIFRISGSQAEINELKEMYDNCQDPFLNSTQIPDVNVAAGLLKMYFRELKDPIFSGNLFHKIIEAYETEREKKCFINKAREIMNGISTEIYVILRYLFAFLKNLSELKEDNMMDSYNLAICFGPCLMPIPIEFNKVLFHMQAIVNEIVRLFIENHNSIFNNPSIDGPLYVAQSYSPPINHAMETSMFSTNDYAECEEANSTLRSQRTKFSIDGSDTLEGSGASDSSSSHNEMKPIDSPPYTAIAIADFNGQTNSELSFQKNDRLVLEEFISDHWWHGRFMDGLGEGLIPLTYVQIVSHPETTGKPTIDSYRSTTPIAILQVNHDIDSHYLHIGPSQLPNSSSNEPVIVARSKSPSPIIQPPGNFSDSALPTGLKFESTTSSTFSRSVATPSAVTPFSRNTHGYSAGFDQNMLWNVAEHPLSNSMQMLSSFGHVTTAPITPYSEKYFDPFHSDSSSLTSNSKSESINIIRKKSIKGGDEEIQSVKNQPTNSLEEGCISVSKDNRSVSSVPNYPVSQNNNSETDIDEALAKVLKGLASIQNQNKPLYRSDLFMTPLMDRPVMNLFKPEAGASNINKELDIQYNPTRKANISSENESSSSKSSCDSINGVNDNKESSMSTSSSINESSIDGSMAFVEQKDCTMRRKSTDAQSF